MKPIKILIVAAILVFAFACKNDDPEVFSKGSFGIAAGGVWCYQVIDTLSDMSTTTDTIVMRAIGEAKHGKSSEFLCVLEKHFETIDTIKIILSDTCLEFTHGTHSRSPLFACLKFRIPFTLGDEWYASKVKSYHSGYEVLSHKYDVYQIDYSEFVPGNRGNKSIFISKNSGIVSMHISYAEEMALYRRSINLIYHAKEINF
mgnify:CR=1 FL=1